jgi:N-acetylglucosaminyldiphosphoundecaprenol N-acetyl-beta-D-mannosaminyltransferase
MIPMPRKKVVLSGYFGFDNLGDEAILEAILKRLTKIENIHPVVLSSHPARTTKQYDVAASHRLSPYHLIRDIATSHLVIQGGGGLLQDKTSFRSLLYYIGILFLAYILGRRVFILCQGLGPFRRFSSEWLVKEFLSQAVGVTLRDKSSLAFIRVHMPLETPLELVADAAFLLEPCSDDRLKDILFEEDLDEISGPLLGIAVKGKTRDKRAQVGFARAIDIITRGYDMHPVFVPFHHPSDTKFAERIVSFMEEKTTILKKRWLPSEYLALFSRFEFVLGMRLHSLIFAAKAKVPFAGISYDPKIDEFLDEFGFKPIARVPILGPEIISEAMEDVLEDRDEYRAKIIKTVYKLEERAEKAFKLLENIIYADEALLAKRKAEEAFEKAHEEAEVEDELKIRSKDI